MDTECFGGVEEIMALDANGVRQPKLVERSRNAYLLFYERVKPVDEPLAPATTSESTTANDDDTDENGGDGHDDAKAVAVAANSNGDAEAKMDVVTGSSAGESPATPALAVPTSPISKELFEQVWSENLRFSHDKLLFDSNYFRFVRDLIKLNPAKPVPRTWFAVPGNEPL